MSALILTALAASCADSASLPSSVGAPPSPTPDLVFCCAGVVILRRLAACDTFPAA